MFYKINSLKLLLFSSLLCNNACFRLTNPEYPKNLPPILTSNSECPDLSGIYSLDSQEYRKDKINKPAKISPLKLSQLENCSEESLWCNKDKIFVIRQTSCKQVEISDPLSVSEWVKSKNSDFTSIPTTSYSKQFVRHNREPVNSSGGSDIISFRRETDKLLLDTSGALIKNRYRLYCGISLIIPIPICYAGSLDIWVRYPKVIEK